MAKTKTTKELPFFTLYHKFIADSTRGKRLQPNGKKLSAGTIRNYKHTLALLKCYTEQKGVTLRIRPVRKLGSRELEVEKNYWKKFYKLFSAYLYRERGYYDNYAGQVFKNIKVFFNYLNKDLLLGVGEFHKGFYVRREEIAIFPLLPEELNYLIYNRDFEASLSDWMQEVKDMFVFGCTVALRVSDLLLLKKSSLRVINGGYYLAVHSVKTGTDTLIKLPDYAVAIVLKYGKVKGRILPHFNASNLNSYIKLLLEGAGYTQGVVKRRDRVGKATAVNKKGVVGSLRFCDVASTHTMRRTAITTMLCLGVPEGVVRKISGHAPASKEFYRYLLLAQTYQDGETNKMFDKLKERTLQLP